MKEELTELLCKLYAAVQVAALSSTMPLGAYNASTSLTFSSCVCVWGLLLENIEYLLPRLVQQSKEKNNMMEWMNLEAEASGETDEDVIREVFHLLEVSVLLPMTHNHAKDIPLSTAESYIELLGIATHPFTVKCARYSSSSTPSSVGDVTLAVLLESCALIRSRIDAFTAPASHRGEEALRITMLYNWVRSVRRTVSIAREPDGRIAAHVLPLCCLVVKRAARDIGHLHLMSLPSSCRSSDGTLALRTALRCRRPFTSSGPSAAETVAQKKPSTEKVSAVLLAESSASAGIAKPLTEEDDVPLLIRSAVEVLRVFADLGALEGRQDAAADLLPCTHHFVDAVCSVLDALSTAPNYDLDAPSLIELMCSILEKPFFLALLSSSASSPARGNRDPVWDRVISILLLLSRVHVELLLSAPDLCRLCLAIADMTVSVEDAKEQHILLPAAGYEVEFRRLKGVTVQRLLSVLTPKDWMTYEAGDGSAGKKRLPMEVRLYQSGARMPVNLWEETCRARGLGSRRSGHRSLSCEPSLCVALIELRSRCGREVAPVTTFTMQCIADCLASVLQDHSLVDHLQQQESTWQAVIGNVEQLLSSNALALIRSCQQLVCQAQLENVKVMRFE